MLYVKPTLKVVEISNANILTTSWLDFGDNLSSENSLWWGGK